MKVVPPNFGYVEEGIFRCGSPAAHHLGFLASLNLKTCILLDDRPNELFVRWLDETGVRILWPLMMMPQTVAASPMLLNTTHARPTAAPVSSMISRDTNGGGFLGGNSNENLAIYTSGATTTTTNNNTTTNSNNSGNKNNDINAKSNTTVHKVQRGPANAPEAESSQAAMQQNVKAEGLTSNLFSQSTRPSADDTMTGGREQTGAAGRVDGAKEENVYGTQERVFMSNPLSPGDADVASGISASALTTVAHTTTSNNNNSNNNLYPADSSAKAIDSADKPGGTRNIITTTVSTMNNSNNNNNNNTSNSVVSNAARFLKESFVDPFVPYLRSPIVPLEPAYIKIHPAPDPDSQEQFTEAQHGERAGQNLAPVYMCNTPFGSVVQTHMSLSEPVVVSILHVLLDPSNYPLLIAGSKGRFRTGMVCGCLRKLQSWNLVSILEEYRRYTGGKARAENEEFIELFDKDLVNLQLPNGRRPTILYDTQAHSNGVR